MASKYRWKLEAISEEKLPPHACAEHPLVNDLSLPNVCFSLGPYSQRPTEPLAFSLALGWRGRGGVTLDALNLWFFTWPICIL